MLLLLLAGTSDPSIVGLMEDVQQRVIPNASLESNTSNYTYHNQHLGMYFCCTPQTAWYWFSAVSIGMEQSCCSMS